MPGLSASGWLNSQCCSIVMPSRKASTGFASCSSQGVSGRVLPALCLTCLEIPSAKAEEADLSQRLSVLQGHCSSGSQSWLPWSCPRWLKQRAGLLLRQMVLLFLHLKLCWWEPMMAVRTAVHCKPQGPMSPGHPAGQPGPCTTLALTTGCTLRNHKPLTTAFFFFVQAGKWRNKPLQCFIPTGTSRGWLQPAAGKQRQRGVL